MYQEVYKCEHCSAESYLRARCPRCFAVRTNYVVVNAPPKKPIQPLLRQEYRDGLVVYVSVATGDVWEGNAKILNPKLVLPHKNRRVKQPVTNEQKKQRVLALERDRYTCLRCGTSKDLTVHHVVHRSQGGKNNLENLQTLCGPCHQYVHHELKLPSGVPFTSEQDAFDRLRRERSKKHGKKPHNYQYGKDLATNFAAPFIQRLRNEVAREQEHWR